MIEEKEEIRNNIEKYISKVTLMEKMNKTIVEKSKEAGKTRKYCLEKSIKEAFDLVLEFHSEIVCLEKSKEYIFPNVYKYLTEKNISKTIQGKFYKIERFLKMKGIKDTDSPFFDKEIFLQEFIIEWRKTHNNPSKNGLLIPPFRNERINK